MTSPNTKPMMQLAHLLINMEHIWNSAGGKPPSLKEMDGELTCMDLLITMAANGICFAVKEP